MFTAKAPAPEWLTGIQGDSGEGRETQSQCQSPMETGDGDRSTKYLRLPRRALFAVLDVGGRRASGHSFNNYVHDSDSSLEGSSSVRAVRGIVTKIVVPTSRKLLRLTHMSFLKRR